MRLLVVTLISLGFTGCSKPDADATRPTNQAAPTEAEVKAETSRILTAMVGTGEPWSVRILEDEYVTEDGAFNPLETPLLRYLVSIRMPDDRPKKSLTGQIQFRDADGEVLYEAPLTHAPDDDSFGLSAIESVEVEYDNENAQHRDLRHRSNNVISFTPKQIVYADGTTADF